jgi:hypothetical protein
LVEDAVGGHRIVFAGPAELESGCKL